MQLVTAGRTTAVRIGFEIRTIALGGRLDPKDLYGVTPLHTTVHDSRLPALSSARWMNRPSRNGLKVNWL